MRLIRRGSARRQRGVWRWLLLGKLALVAGFCAAVALHLLLNAWLASQRPRIEALLAEATGAPARLGEVRLVWRGFEPLLELRDARLLLPEHGAAPLRLRGLQAGVAPLPLLGGDIRLGSLRLAGLDLALREREDGSWDLGLPRGAGAVDWQAQARRLARLDHISLRGVQLLLVGRDGGSLPLALEEARLQPEKGGWRVRARLRTADGSGRVTAEGRIQGVAEAPAQWRHLWQLELRGSFDLGAMAAALRPDWPALPRLAGSRFSVELRRQGSASSYSWLMSLSAQTASLQIGGETQAQGLAFDAAGRLTAEAMTLEVPRMVAFGDAEASRGEGAEDLRLRAERAPGEADWQRLELSARQLDLRLLSPWLRSMGADLPALSGQLQRASLRYGGGAAALAYRGRVEGLSLQGPAYDIGPLDGAFEGDGEQGSGALQADAATLALPEVLFTPVPGVALETPLSWQRQEGGWLLEAAGLTVAAAGAELSGTVQLRLPDAGPPRLTLDLGLAAAGLDPLKPYMPRDWAPPLRDYLARALEGGRVAAGRLRLDTDLAAGWWRAEDTDFLVALELREGELRFHPDWPPLRQLDAGLRIERPGITVRLETGRFADLRLQGVDANIGLGADARLQTSVRHSAGLGDWYTLLARTPLRERLAGLIEQTRAEGMAELQLSLDMPLADVSALVARGRVGLDGAALEVLPLGDTVREVRGGVHFVNASVASENLRGRLHGRPLTARLDTRDGVPYLSAQTDVDIGDGAGLARFVPEVLRRDLSGTLSTTMALRLQPLEDGRLPLDLRIDIAALESRLPQPLQLSPQPGRAPATARILLREGAVDRLQLRVPQLLELQHAGDSALLHLGPGVAPDATPGAGLHVSGAAEAVDLRGWLQRFSAPSTAAAERSPAAADADADADANTDTEAPRAAVPSLHLPPLRRARLGVETLLVGSLQLPDLALDVRAGAETMRIDVDGSSQGEIDYRIGEPGHLRARMGRLQLTLPPGPEDEAAATSAPAAAAADAERWSPHWLPEMDLLVAEAWLGPLLLGEMDLRLQRDAEGARLQRLRFGGGALQGEVSGFWLLPEKAASGAPVMAITAELSSGNIDGLLSAFGYARTLQAERAELSADLAWPQVEGLASLAGARGDIRFDLRRGALQQVEPGAGRALFLFSFNALPRRLGLDFRDVTKSGLAFDSLSGSFQLADGDAVTEDIELKSPSMRVEVDGRVGLAARDYDQRIRVYPDLSGGVTLGAAALLGGPIGIGLALVAGEVLEKPLDRITRVTYRIRGSWDDPELLPGEVVTADGSVARPAQPEQPPAQAAPSPQPAEGKAQAADGTPADGGPDAGGQEDDS